MLYTWLILYINMFMSYHCEKIPDINNLLKVSISALLTVYPGSGRQQKHLSTVSPESGRHQKHLSTLGPWSGRQQKYSSDAAYMVVDRTQSKRKGCRTRYSSPSMTSSARCQILSFLPSPKKESTARAKYSIHESMSLFHN